MQILIVLSMVIAGSYIVQAIPSGGLHFPEDDDDIPEPCRNLTYCVLKPKNYPEKKYSEMLKNYKAIAHPKLVMTVSFDNRQTEFGDDCASTVTYDPLYKVREKRSNEWHNVIQAPDRDYIQSVRLETCTNVGAKCFKDIADFQDSYVTFCAQKYNTWKVLADTKSGKGEPELIDAELPVCCFCSYKPV